MASFSMEEFLGEGALKGLIPKLVAGGWDDVPTIKMMNSEDMDWIKLTQQQKDALELRSYLHDRSLMEYADRLEASGKSLAELLSTSTVVLSSQFGMKRGHVARFIDRASACRVSMPPSYVLPARERSMSISSSKGDEPSRTTERLQYVKTPSKVSSYQERSVEQSAADFKIGEGYIFKGMVAAEPAEPRLCGCVQPPPIVEHVAPYSSIENISVQKLTPEYKVGMGRLVAAKAPPMKALELWKHKPTILLCIRRPGCVMCRAEAHQLYSRKPIFDALGFQLVAVLHEQIESEIRDFWPRYWGGVVILDQSMDFFKALGGGKLLKDKFITGFLLNPRAIANYKRAQATGFEKNYKGEGEIKGGLFIIGSGKRGIAYQFIERNFGDWAPIAEVIDVCSQLQRELPGQGESP
ncbi:Redox-regulatory protein FAM213A [Cocos nucifera]|uniref:Peroxiredoxin-like 2A n=1 Tax=Cocos nucifera TaxID=13894 RepID=A0A8K0HU05_COCNU|nr:Redox-regulatory protein FAM213A [Cocos nucifera]